ncbi:hypothetical protein AL00_17220 [Sphingobium indicum F2]|uniref:Uncharacterized protein n=1 Tax=Sphingobium indicum F2 TaxID=1450518 RepID=A0A8E0WQ31_9SPHN|nr:hypothetical protein AL00_17220 [Sphingobium indicum F2]
MSGATVCFVGGDAAQQIQLLCRRRVDPRVPALAELVGHLLIDLVRIVSHWRFDLTASKHRSKRSRMPIRRDMAWGEEQSIRIFPSQLAVMKRNVGSMVSRRHDH